MSRRFKRIFDNHGGESTVRHTSFSENIPSSEECLLDSSDSDIDLGECFTSTPGVDYVRQGRRPHSYSRRNHTQRNETVGNPLASSETSFVRRDISNQTQSKGVSFVNPSYSHGDTNFYNTNPFENIQSNTQSNDVQSKHSVKNQTDTVDPSSKTSQFNPFLTLDKTGSATTYKKQKDPEKFDGQTVDFRDYIVQFEQIANWNQWSVVEMAQQLTMCLSGEARKMLGHIDRSKLADYYALKEILLKRFCPPERKAAYATEFYARVKKPGESIDEFGYALRRLWYLAFPGEGSADVHLIKAFINGLSDLEMKKHISLSHPATLEAAIGLAIEYEAVLNSFGTKPSFVKAVRSRSKSPNPDKTDEVGGLVKVLQNCFSELKKDISDLSSKGHREPTCFTCGVKGHISPNCPKRERKVSFREPSQQLNK